MQYLVFDLIPGLNDLFKCNPINNPDPNCRQIAKIGGAVSFTNLSDLISSILTIALYAAAFLSFFWLAWGAFAYIMAQGKKEDLEKARARITWALLGLAFTLLAFFIAKFMSEIFKPEIGGVPF